MGSPVKIAIRGSECNRDLSPVTTLQERPVKIAGMKWVPLYALTALVTGLHNFYGLMSMVNGAPINLLNCISLLGSATLLGAAFLLPFRPSFAANVELAGSVLSWV